MSIFKRFYIILIILGGCCLSCSFVYEYEECKQNDDCGRSEMCDQGYCVERTLFVEKCQTLHGVEEKEAFQEDTVLLGSILPFSGQLSPYGPKIAQGVQLAVDEINQAGGISGKKLAVLFCDSGTDPNIAVQSAEHLVKIVGVPAIIGPAASSITEHVFTKTVKQSGVLMMSPAATSPFLSNIDDGGFLWRTAPSDAIQGAGIADYILNNLDNFERIAIINRDDAYGNGLRDAVIENICGNFDCTDDSKLFVRSYGEGTFVADQSKIVVELSAFSPDITLLISFFDDGKNLLEMLKGQSIHRFILADGLKSEDLFTISLDPQTVCSTMGTQPASPSGEIYQSFALRFRARFRESDGAYSANAYDATYLIAYAIGAAKGSGNDGKTITKNLTRLSSGEVIEAGPTDWNPGLKILTGDGNATINYEGAAGPLDFDANGEAASDIEAWAMDLDNESIKSLGVLYGFDGTYNDIVTEPPGIGELCNSQLNAQPAL